MAARPSALVLAVLLVLLLLGLPAGAQDPLPTQDPAPEDALVLEARIIRDGYGVPHVYADTLEEVSYGAGYAIAQDRLFQMDVLRHVSKGQLAQLFGPIPGFVEADAAARTLFYTDAERRAKFTTLTTRLQRMLLAYVDGVNAWIDAVRSDPAGLPLEYTQFGLGPPEPWDVTDSLAIAEMLVETFGAGGGTEVERALLLNRIRDELGDAAAVAAFGDIRWINDPGAPVSIPPDYDWRSTPSLAGDLPAKEWRRDARIGLGDLDRQAVAAASNEGGPAIGTLAQADLVPRQPSGDSLDALAAHNRGLDTLRSILHFGSNAFVTGPSRTAGGGTVQLGGPQVGHFTPEIIGEFGLHVPAANLDMTGLTFAGSGPVVLIGRTPHFAWTTTTGNSDGGDVYVEELGSQPETYVYDGRVERMDCRDETIAVRQAPAETIRVCRTRHGPVLASDGDNGVAYAIRRSWFDHENGTIEGFAAANFVTHIATFSQAINQLQSNHNMFYVDADGHYGYWHPGAIPVRADGTDMRLPQDGRFSATEWQRILEPDEMPHAVDFPQGWLANWNNKPAVDWPNGDGANYGSVFRNQLWNDLLAAEDAMSLERGEEFNRINGTTELEWTFFRGLVVEAGRASDDEQVRAAAEVLAGWDARREDADGDGLVDSEPGYTLWRDWRDIAIEMAFADDLGDVSDAASDSMLLHVLQGEQASLPPSRDWLNGRATSDFLNAVMRANLDALAAEFETDDMAQWASPMPQQHYTRLNVRFYDCEVTYAVDPATPGCADQLPGNVRDLDYMNRGTYNHLVEYLPGATTGAPELLEAPGVGPIVEHHDDHRVLAESIISPGQSGFIDHLGREDPHYDDQHELYASWQYKPMPVREADVLELGDGEIVEVSATFTLDALQRLAGPDRIGTAVALSEATFSSAEAVVVASADDFPDALAAAPLAGVLEAPVLLAGDSLPDRVAAEIERLAASEVVIVGGTAAVGTAVEEALTASGLTVRRIAGANRYATAAEIAREVAGAGGGAPGSDTEVVVASGRSFPDALSVGSVAAGLGLPIVLTEPDRLPEESSAVLAELGPDATFVIGGPNAVGDAVVTDLESPTRLAGNDRYATSAAVAEFGVERGLAGATVFVATGRAFPDGLTAGPAAAAAGGLLVLLDGRDPAAADGGHGFLANQHAVVGTLVVAGGQAAVTPAVAERARLAVSQR